jgi:hypothetical protein
VLLLLNAFCLAMRGVHGMFLDSECLVQINPLFRTLETEQARLYVIMDKKRTEKQ